MGFMWDANVGSSENPQLTLGNSLILLTRQRG